jgi:hypothetical protein
MLKTAVAPSVEVKAPAPKNMEALLQAGSWVFGFPSSGFERTLAALAHAHCASVGKIL